MLNHSDRSIFLFWLLERERKRSCWMESTSNRWFRSTRCQKLRVLYSHHETNYQLTSKIRGGLEILFFFFLFSFFFFLFFFFLFFFFTFFKRIFSQFYSRINKSKCFCVRTHLKTGFVLFRIYQSAGNFGFKYRN